MKSLKIQKKGCNRKPSIEEHTMQWLSENEQNDNQWSRKYCGMSFIGQHESH